MDRGAGTALNENALPGSRYFQGIAKAARSHASRSERSRRMHEPAAKSARAVCVGEVVMELKRGADGRFALWCGGDTFNTAVGLARAGIEAAFATAIGDDPYSDSIMALAAAEDLSSRLICALLVACRRSA